jgi:hypothetical protein
VDVQASFYPQPTPGFYGGGSVGLSDRTVPFGFLVCNRELPTSLVAVLVNTARRHAALHLILMDVSHFDQFQHTNNAFF